MAYPEQVGGLMERIINLERLKMIGVRCMTTPPGNGVGRLLEDVFTRLFLERMMVFGETDICNKRFQTIYKIV